MRTTRRRALLAGFALLLVGASTLLVGRGLAGWHQRGWAGLAYRGATAEMLEGELIVLQPAPPPLHVAGVAVGSPADRAGIARGDRLRAISGVPIEDAAALADLATRSRRGDRIAYEIVRDGGPQRVELVLGSPFATPLVAGAVLTALLVGLAFLGICLVVAWSRPGSEPALVLYLLGAASTVVFMLMPLYVLRFPDLRGIQPLGTGAQPIVQFLATALASLVLIDLLLHLALVFPRRRPVVRSWPEVLVWLHTVPFLPAVLVVVVGLTLGVASTALQIAVGAATAGAAAAIAVSLLRRLRRSGWRALLGSPLHVQGLAVCGALALGQWLGTAPERLHAALGVAAGALLLLWMVGVVIAYSVLTVIALARSYGEADRDEKRQVRWPLWGTSVAVAASLLLSLVPPMISALRPELQQHAVTSYYLIMILGYWPYVLIPLTFAFAILRYRLLDVDLLISRTVVYGGVTAFILAAYLVTVGGLGVWLVSATGVRSQTVTVIATLAIAVLLVPVRNRLQSFAERRFLPQRHGLEEARAAVAESVLRGAPLEQLLPELAERVHEGLGVRLVAVLVRDPDVPQLRPAAGLGLPDGAHDDLVLDAGLPWLASGERVVRLDATGGADRLRAARLELAATVRLKGETVGLVAVGAPPPGQALEEEDRSFLVAVADQLALALGNLQRRPEELEASQAREIQRSLLPATLPHLARAELAATWLPARETSGDYYDAFELGGGAVAIAIGDVVGKGMPAALLMSGLHAALRAVAAPGIGPAEVCDRLRTVVCPTLAGGRFVTLFYAVLEPGGRRLAFCNAGHNPPLLVRADGSVERLTTGGPAVARVLRRLPYHEAAVDLNPGDRLVLFTDGATEATDAAGEMLGEERLGEVVRAHRSQGGAALRDRVVTAVRAHAERGLGDDLTLLVLAVG